MKKHTAYIYTIISLLLLATEAEAVIKIDKQGTLTGPNLIKMSKQKLLSLSKIFHKTLCNHFFTRLNAQKINAAFQMTKLDVLFFSCDFFR
jgi:hypothetical protein